MSLIYIAGVSGMGKSAVLNELKDRKYTAYGVDEDSFGKWINRETNTVGDIDEASLADSFDIHDWLRDYAWVFDIEKVSRLHEESVGKVVYLCGTAESGQDIISYFDKIFALHMDDTVELKRRIDERVEPDFGKNPEEFARILEWHKNVERQYEEMGAVVLDATQPVSVTVDYIINN